MAAGPAILLVDDHADLREALGRLFRREGFEVAEANNGAEALDYLDSGADVSLIVLDLGMPVMDGWVFLKTWRNHPNWWPVPVLVLTGLITDTRLKELGDLMVLTKPFQIDDLLSVARRLMRKAS